ncbi:MAG: YjjG family noncanonical pyrimidine nucleotidase [Bacillus sp. (in: Bacteria)]|nr:YjjG family noncanonical pyrimidine nucleotidase [Bacillus sp. (in: firmicutes)]
MKYETILFDIDDTLFDFGISEKKALHKAFLEHGYPTGVEEYRASYKEISKVLWGDLEQGLTTLAELGVERFKRLFLRHKLSIDPKGFNRVYLGYLGMEIHLIEGAFDLCASLAGIQLAVITNGFKAVQLSRIGSSPLVNTFKHIIVSEDAGFQKPDKRIFDYAFSKLEIVDKANVLIVGDSLTSDIQGGINYGIDTCWFNPHSKQNNSGIRPTFEIRELTGLLKIIKKDSIRM